MKTYVSLLLVCAAALLATPLCADTILTFDDLPDPGIGLPNVPNGYGGLQWVNFSYGNTTTSSFVTGSSGAVSPPNAATTTNFVATFSRATPFTFKSVYLTTTLIDPTLPAEIKGYSSGGTLVFDQTITVNQTPTLFTFNYTDVTVVEFDTIDFTELDNLDLVLGTSFGRTPGLSPNQRGVGSTLDGAGAHANASLGRITNVLQNFSPSALGNALDELSPVKFGNFASTTSFNNESFETAAMDMYLENQRSGAHGTFAGGNGQLDASGLTVNDPNVDPSLQMVHSRMLAWNSPATEADMPSAVLGGIAMKDPKAMCSCGEEPASPWNVFIRGNVILGQGLSQGDQAHFDDNTESVVVGADYRFTPNFLIGLTAGYAHTDATLDTQNSSATVDSYSPGIYASYANSGWYANFLGRYSHNSYTDARNISFLGQTANGATDGNEGVADLDGGYDFHSGAFTYGPVAGVQYTHLTVDGYHESGSDANLAVREDQSDSLRSRLGVNLKYDFQHCGLLFSPHLQATWQHEFMDQSRGLTSQFTNFTGGSFAVRTQGASDDFALVDAGLDARVNDLITVFADYLIQAGQDNYFGQSVHAGVKFNF